MLTLKHRPMGDLGKQACKSASMHKSRTSVAFIASHGAQTPHCDFMAVFLFQDPCKTARPFVVCTGINLTDLTLSLVAS